MAPLNGMQHTVPGVRKRMIQPVLPALPLVSKAKQTASKIEEQQSPLDAAATDGARTSGVLGNGQLTDITGHGVVEDSVDTSIREPEKNDGLASTGMEEEGSDPPAQPTPQTSQLSTHIEIDEEQDTAEARQNGINTLNLIGAGDSAAADSVETCQTDMLSSNTNGRRDKEYASPKPETPVDQIAASTVHDDGDQPHAELPVRAVMPPLIDSVISPTAEKHLEPNHSISTSSYVSPEARTNGHISPVRPPGLHHHSLSHPTPVRSTQMPTIHEHLLHLANSKQWADWIIEVNQPEVHLQPFVGYAHSFVLLRSEKIRKIITRPQDPTFASNIITLRPARITQPHAFEAALRFLYSDTVLSAEALFPRDTYMDKHARAHVVDYTLSYWTAGIELGLEPVSTRAFNLLAGMVDWDIAELLVKEVMNIRSFAPLVQDIETPSESTMMADSILRQVFRLFTHHLDLAQFRLDIEAQASLLAGRFAQVDQGRPISNPALAGMVFGSMPSTGNHSPSTPIDASSSLSADTVASIILLNLDWADLCVLSREITGYHGKAGLRILSETIEERERRRLQVLSNRSVPNKHRMANSILWDVFGFREYLDHGKLVREHVGYLLPPKRQ